MTGMGGAASTPVGTDTPTILNFILREMFRKADLVDIYSLADKTRCARYVVAGADALQTLFVKLSIYPNKKDGILYFQSIDGLLKGMPRDLQEKRRQYCVELAFFFIRIFQTYGALALSIIDSKMPVSEPPDDIISTTEQQKQGVFLNPKNFYGFKQKPQEKGWFGFGGALTPKSGNFFIQGEPYSILNYHLYSPDGGASSAQPMKMESFQITVNQDTLYNLSLTDNQVTSRSPKGDPKPILNYFLQRNSSNYRLVATLVINGGGGDYTVTLANFKRDGIDAPNVKITTERLQSFGGQGSIPQSAGQAYSLTKGKPLPNVLQAMFEDAANQIFGMPPFSVVKFLREKKYVTSSDRGDLNITGTHIYIAGGQENASPIRILFKDSKSFGADQRRSILTISAMLTIDEPIYSSLQGTYTYKVTVDFTNSQIQPSEAKDYITLKTFRTTEFTAYSKDGAPKTVKNDMSIPDYIETIFQDTISNKDSLTESRIKFTRDGLATPYDSDQIPEDMRVKKLWAALAKDPPVKAHCVARATQLLSLEAFNGNFTPQAFSSACRVGFGYQKDGSLPLPGKPITEEYGLHATAILFYQTGVPKLIDEPKYREFLKFLRYTMEKTESLEKTGEAARMSQITERVPRFCDNKRDQKVLIPADLARSLRTVALDLLRQQNVHVNTVMNINFMLFDRDSIVKRKVFAFNKNILAGGMPEVNRVAGIARNALANYYMSCETKYKSGLELIYRYDSVKPLSSLGPDGTVIQGRKIEPTVTAPM